MSAPDITEAEVEAVIEVVRSGRLALGPRAEQFETELAEYAGVQHAIAVNSGTAALHLIVRYLEIGPGDEVIVPSFTFAASVNAILYEGGTPVFADIQPDTYNIDPKDIARKISQKTRAIMAVDVFGHPADWDEIDAVAGAHGIPVIDDCCEALGACYRERRIGGFGLGGAFAFYPNKQITTGEGGAIVTNDDGLARLARSLRNQGRDDGDWLVHNRLGYNYRLNEMSAALGCKQLERIEEIVARRASVAESYSCALDGLKGVALPTCRSYARHSWFVYVVALPCGLRSETVIGQLAQLGIPARNYFAPIHTQPYMRDRLGKRTTALPITDSISQRTMALPFHTNMSDNHVEMVVSALRSVLGSQ
jgi:perosamine synthetase